MRNKCFLATVLAALVFVTGNAPADDTDVYANNGLGVPENSEPMVMFTLDYRPNLGSTACNGTECDFLIDEGWLSPVGPYTFFHVLRAVLRKVFEPLAGVKVGLMLNHDNLSGCTGPAAAACSNGGQIAMGFELFDAADSNGAKARFHAILDAMPIPQGGQSHSFQGKELYFEFFRYLTGQDVYNAHNGWTDYFTDNTSNLDVDRPGADWDSTIEMSEKGKTVYESPLLDVSECTKLYTVNPLFQVSNQDDDSDLALLADIGAGGMGKSLGKNPDFTNVVDYLADRDLANGKYGDVPNLEGDQFVTSYFLVDPRFINNTTIGYAQAGGTGLPLPLSDDPETLVETFNEIFRQILSVSTTFVAASVPVNVFNRAQVTDNVYLALFQVPEDGNPAWPGNVKKLRLVNSNDPSLPTFLVDATGSPAVAPDGRIKFDALTYWTNPGALPPADPDLNEVDGADGRAITRGGAGQKIPGYLGGTPHTINGIGGRTIYYDILPNALADLDLDWDTVTALEPMFGAADLTEAIYLLAHARGLDIDDQDTDGILNEARDWILGDPLHSRPIALNYGALGSYTESNPAIYLAVGTNDGMMHMIRNTNPDGSESGAEAWAFMPQLAMPNQKALRANTPGIEHPYAVDGAPTAYFDDTDLDGTIESGENVYLYFGMRRGGKAYFAMNVTNPERPRLMWTIDKSGDFAELGHTFSTPRIGKVRTASGPRPALIFGGGYDMNKDDRGGAGTNDTEGNAIFVVDAETGDLIWKARGALGGASSTVFEHPALVDSIPSTLTIADTDGDTLTDRIVVGDMGGNIWRADLSGSGTADWKLTLLASLGRHAPGASGGATDDRRFFHRPDLVPTRDGAGNFDAVLVGSGDRADPLDGGGAVEDHFYMIKDRNVLPGGGINTGIGHGDLGDVTDNCLQTGGACAVDLTNGWKLLMQDAGEKILATPLTIDGKVFFTSYLPGGGKAPAACAPSEGAGRLWTVGLQDGRSVINYSTADDDPDNPGEPTTTADRYTELKAPGIPSEVVSVPPNKILRPDLTIDTIPVTTRWRTFWYVDEDTE
jgi:type IV pilus assembly protein PilY1